MKAYAYFATCLFVTGLLVVTPACASQGYLYWSPDRSYSMDIQRRAYDEGYRAGLNRGRNDARGGRAFDYVRHGDYRDADRGYRSSFGNRAFYGGMFRRGFVAGYTQAYRSTRSERYNFPIPGRRY
jgi:hypothetical protein